MHTTDAVHQTQFVLLNESTTPVLSRLSFHVAEPYAVTVAFRTERGRWIEWTFARDLLVAGLDEPTGIGDVRIRPDLSEDEALLTLEIESPDGYASFELERADLEAFLESSYELVPLGAESEHFDIEGLIEEISNV
ncbi:SsgA family sporulation/cell division regulator [Amycolatopsis silviterrae]|uniref:SsgA family sporulation/cell division regulator n=1 Tax=Amycolatopsis silviterrae TaxID=1656914 RepID=A0ABW5H1Y0_9PSEU